MTTARRHQGPRPGATIGRPTPASLIWQDTHGKADGRRRDKQHQDGDDQGLGMCAHVQHDLLALAEEPLRKTPCQPA